MKFLRGFTSRVVKVVNVINKLSFKVRNLEQGENLFQELCVVSEMFAYES